MTKEKLAKSLLDTKFTFAKSMPKIPHCWSARQDWLSDQEFNKVVIHIRMYGVTEKFWRKEYVYFYANGYKYWTMGNSIDITRIINRAKLD